MSIVVAALTLILLAAVIFVVSGPLLSIRKPDEPDTPQRADLQAAREAKYQEIRDTELDYRTGKLSSEDFQAVNGTLRAEAVEILDKLEVLEREPNAEEEGNIGGKEPNIGGEELVTIRDAEPAKGLPR